MHNAVTHILEIFDDKKGMDTELHARVCADRLDVEHVLAMWVLMHVGFQN